MVRTIRKRAFITVCIASGMVGCGGGADQHPAGTVGASSKIGEAVVTYFGRPMAQLAAAAGPVSVVGQAGATYTNIILEPAPKLSDTYLAFTRLVNNDLVLYQLPYGSNTPQLVFQNAANNVLTPGISVYGTIAFGLGGSTYTIRPDGTGLHTLSFSGMPVISFPQYATDGTNRICFGHGGSLYVGPGVGGTATQVQSSSAQTAPGVWNPAGNKIAYAAPTGTNFNNDVRTTAPTGGATTDVTPAALVNGGTFTSMSWSADGDTLLAAYTSAEEIPEVIKFSASNSGSFQILTPNNDEDFNCCFSPDGSRIAIYRNTANGATAGIYVCDTAGLNQTLLYPDPSNDLNSVVSLQWSPFLPKETVVAASGSTFFHQAASGFLLSQNGSGFGSMVAFTATTPSTATIQAPAASSGVASLLFTLSANAITSIGYINNYFDSGTTITLSSAPSVVVAIDATTGQVDTVAPAATPRAAPTKNADGSFTYRAAFQAVYNGKGRNLAPNGASQITLNPKTGKLVGFK